jgi:hypothetical protein
MNYLYALIGRIVIYCSRIYRSRTPHPDYRWPLYCALWSALVLTLHLNSPALSNPLHQAFLRPKYKGEA